MKSDQAEQLDALLSQLLKALNQDQKTENIDASSTSKGITSPLLLWKIIVKAENKGINQILKYL